MHTLIRGILAAAALGTIVGCETTTWYPPSPLTEIEAAEIVFGLEREHPREKIYRQYVRGNQYLQFDRVGEQQVMYGWRTCTTCSWTRTPMSSVYTGDYLYVIYGQHDDFFVGSPSDQRLHPEFGHWSWSTVEKYRVEGRNLLLLTEFRACSRNLIRVEEWSNSPWSVPGQIDCRYRNAGDYSRLWVATIDETLAGERDSMVETIEGNVEERLNQLEALLRDGLISESEYQDARRGILDDI